jgi:hypothetical protein
MKRQLWLIAAVSVSGTLLVCALGARWLWHELDAWAAATPQKAARLRTERLLAAAQAKPTGPLPTQFQTDGIDPNCWGFLQTVMAIRQPQPHISVAENGTPGYRDDDLSVTITFTGGGAVHLLYLAGGIVDCTTEQPET